MFCLKKLQKIKPKRRPINRNFCTVTSIKHGELEQLESIPVPQNISAAALSYEMKRALLSHCTTTPLHKIGSLSPSRLIP